MRSLTQSLPKINQPILIVQSKDTLLDHAALAKRLPPRIRIEERIDLGNGLFYADPKSLASAPLAFLTLDSKRIRSSTSAK